MRAARSVLWLSAVGFAGFGVAYLVAPAPMAAATGVALPDASARADFVATYAGLQLGIAGFLLACTRRAARVEAGLLATGWLLLGFGAARVVGILTAGGPVRGILHLFLAIEIFGCALAFWAARRAVPTAGGHPHPQEVRR